MTTVLGRMLVLVALALAACQPASPAATPTPRAPTPRPIPTLPPAPDPSFALHFEYGVCYLHVLDTATQTFQRQVPGQAVIEVPLALDDADLAVIYAKLRDIDFLSYPAQFVVVTPASGVVVEVMPSESYRLTVRSGDTTHTVAWTDDQPRTDDPTALPLRELFRLIKGLVALQPALQALPTPNVGCL
jgi:hypothetical protein